MGSTGLITHFSRVMETPGSAKGFAWDLLLPTELPGQGRFGVHPGSAAGNLSGAPRASRGPAEAQRKKTSIGLIHVKPCETIVGWHLQGNYHSWVVRNGFRPLTVGFDSLSILFNHRSFQKPDPFSLGFKGGFLERRIPGKNGEGSPRILNCNDLTDRIHPKWWFMWGISPHHQTFQVGEIVSFTQIR